MKIEIDPIIPVKDGSCEKDLCRYVPAYAFRKTHLEYGFFYQCYWGIICKLISLTAKTRLMALGARYKKYSADSELDNGEIERIYLREAGTYEKKHHLTTNFRDRWWRRQAGMDVISYAMKAQKKNVPVVLLDIAAGVGASIQEMFEMFKLFDVDVVATALDYNESMLMQARSVTLPRMKTAGLIEPGKREVLFVKGDARRLSAASHSANGYTTFPSGSIDCITITFGIGGIDCPITSFEEQLIVLKPNGIVALKDMHRPIMEIDEQWPIFIDHKRPSSFSYFAWEKVTKPVILRTLWGWRDPTYLYYILPLITARDPESGKYYGFELESFSIDTEFWWLKSPVISTAHSIVRKVEIDRNESDNRRRLFDRINIQ